MIGALQPALVILISAPLLNEKVAKGAATWALVGLAGTVPSSSAPWACPAGAWPATPWPLSRSWLDGLLRGVAVGRGQTGALEYSTVTAVVASLVAWPTAAVFGQDLPGRTVVVG